MRNRTMKTLSMAAGSALLLSGCAAYGWPIVSSGEGCGEIQLAQGQSQYPRLTLDGDISGDVQRTRSSVEFDVIGAPEDFYKAPTVQDPDRLFGYAVPSLPVGWLVEAQASLGWDEEDEPDFQIGDDFIFGFQVEVPEPLSVNASGNFTYSSGVAVEDALAPLLGEDYGLGYWLGNVLGSEGALLPFVYSFLHLPTTLIASCGEPITEEAFDEFPGDVSADVSRVPMRLDQSSTMEIYPGYVEDLIAFESYPSSISFGSVDPSDGRIPLAATVVPWFSGFEDLITGGEVEVDFNNMTEFERFWLTQLLFLELYVGSEDADLENIFSFLNFDYADDQQNMPTSTRIEAELDLPLTQETYEQRFLTITNSYAIPGEEQTIEELREEFGDLRYLFIYTIFFEELDNGDLELSYSFDRYYPGVAGNLVTEQVFEQEQAQLAQFSSGYSGPVVGSVMPNPVAAGETVTLLGSNLDQVTGLEIDGKQLKIESKTENSLSATLPMEISAGLKDLVISSASGDLTAQGAVRVVSPATGASAAASKSSIKMIGQTKARVHVSNLTAKGKAQIFLNGKEVAWVNAKTSADPKLRGGALVRTLDLEQGKKNVIEVLLDGKRQKRVVYSR